MATGKIHARAGAVLLVLGGGAGVAAWAISRPPESEPVFVGWLTGLVLGWLITPDLDVDRVTHEEWRMSKVPIVGPLLMWGWVALWWPYARLMPHRSTLSHTPGLSTALRMGYLAGLVLLAALAAGWQLPRLDGLAVAACWLAWTVQDAVHWVLDL